MGVSFLNVWEPTILKSSPNVNAIYVNSSTGVVLTSTFFVIFLAGNFFPFEVFKKPFSKIFSERLDTFVG